MATSSLDGKLGSQVTVDGTARNAALGAVVMGDAGVVYIGGLERWDRAIDGKQVSVTGTLAEIGPDNVINAAGEHSHGSPDARLVLERASWSVK